VSARPPPNAWGLITYQQALASGVSRNTIKQNAAKGRWRRLLPRVYATEESPAFEQQALAGCLWAGPHAVVSHRAAGRLHELAGMERAAVELTVPLPSNPRSPRVIVHHAEVARTQHARIRGVPVTDVERTLVDLAAVLGEIDLAIAVEDAWHRRLIHPYGLRSRAELDAGRGKTGTRLLRRILDDCDKRRRPMESPLEVRLWWLLRKSKLEIPITQYDFRDEEGPPLRLDFAYERHRLAIEADGFETHRERFERDRERAGRLAACGWRLIPVTHRALQKPHRVVDWIRRSLSCEQPIQPWEES
jgi:very-short-patch-repair endonuclease